MEALPSSFPFSRPCVTERMARGQERTSSVFPPTFWVPILSEFSQVLRMAEIFCRVAHVMSLKSKVLKAWERRRVASLAVC